MKWFIQRHPILSICGGLFLAGLVTATVLLRHSAIKHELVYVNESVALTNALRKPPLLAPHTENGELVFDLTAQAGQTEFFSNTLTDTWGYNGTYLGPTLRASTGDHVRINFTNALGESTTVHWHGMEVPAAMDGGPHQVIANGATWEPDWTVTNLASTLWYHPHLLNETSRQVYHGLAGLFIIDDAVTAALDLPDEYGVDDLPLVIQDRKFDSAGQFVYDHNHMSHMSTTAGMLGDTILVNGTYAPYVEAPAKLIRLRLVNGSNARRYNFGFSDQRSFYQIATDGGLLAAPVERTRLLLAPGERAEILVDLSTATEPITLMSYNVEREHKQVPDAAQDLFIGETDEDQQFKILEIRPIAGDYPAQTIPTTLTAITPLNPATASQTRDFTLQASTINSRRMDHARVDEVVQQGDTEIWSVRNESPIFHPFHIHGVQFQILERGGQPAPAYEQGWKDTVNIDPGETVKLIIQFNMAADPTLPYMYHCHILEHEDMGMMGQFVVLPDDTTPVELQSTLDSSSMDMGGMDMNSMHHQH